MCRCNKCGSDKPGENIMLKGNGQLRAFSSDQYVVCSFCCVGDVSSTFCPSPLCLSSSEHAMRITLLILPKDPTKSVTSCSDASFGMPVRYTRRFASNGSWEAGGTVFFFRLAGGTLADWKSTAEVCGLVLGEHQYETIIYKVSKYNSKCSLQVVF